VPLHPQKLNFNTSVKFGENYIALIKGYMLGWKRRKKKGGGGEGKEELSCDLL